MLTYDALESNAERALWDRVDSGEWVDCSVGTTEGDDPCQGSAWGAERTVRAEVIVQLLSTNRADEAVQPRALRLRGAHISGTVDLEALTLLRRLDVEACFLERPVVLTGAKAISIRLSRCCLPAVQADQVETRGDLALDAIRARRVDVTGARIGGLLSLRHASLSDPDGVALAASRACVRQGLDGRGLTVEGEVSLLAAEIEGQLRLGGASLVTEKGSSVTADGLRVAQGMFCQDGFSATGEMRVLNARIDGPLVLSGARLANTQGPAFSGDGMRVGGGMFCEHGFTVVGELRLTGAHIEGGLFLADARLQNPGAPALSADGLHVGRGVRGPGLVAHGEIRLNGAEIGGQLLLSSARLANGAEPALSGDGLRIGLGMFCRQGFESQGEVRLIGAAISGELVFSDARLENPDGIALRADRLRVQQGLYGTAITVRGGMRLPGCEIRQQLVLADADLAATNEPVINGDSLSVEGDMLCRHVTVQGDVRLTGGSFHGTLDLSECARNPGGRRRPT